VCGTAIVASMLGDAGQGRVRCSYTGASRSSDACAASLGLRLRSTSRIDAETLVRNEKN
jgi:hypothetical protein